MRPFPLTHEMTVELLGRFDKLQAEVQDLLKDPLIGQIDLRSKIGNSLPELMSGGVVTPDDVPYDPIEQVLWLQFQWMQAHFIKIQVLTDHAKSCRVDKKISDTAISKTYGHA